MRATLALNGLSIQITHEKHQKKKRFGTATYQNMILFGGVSILLFPSKALLLTGLLKSNGFINCQYHAKNLLIFDPWLHTGVVHMIHLKKATFMTSLLKKGGILECLSYMYNGI